MIPSLGMGQGASITGGTAGPSSADGTFSTGMNVGSLNMGSPSNRVNPMVALAIALIIIAALYLYAKK